MTVTLNNPANAVASGGSTGANPTASVGLSAVNGTANTFLRSDGAPALDQTIAPTWTSVHTFRQAVDATSTDGIVLSTSQTATSGNQKYSPRTRYSASYFSGSAKTFDWVVENRPQTNAGRLGFLYSDNGGAYTEMIYADKDRVGCGNAEFDNAGYLSVYTTAANTMSRTISKRTFILDGARGSMFLPSDGMYSFSDVAAGTADVGVTPDTIIMRGAAANVRYGAAAANPPVAQTLSVQDASGTDIAGATWTFRASRGTGAAAVTGKSFVWQTPDVGTTGTTLQTATEKLALTGDGNVIQSTVNGAQWIRGQASELLTLSTSGTTTDTSANLLPANSIIEAVVARVTTTITTATDWKLGDATTAARFTSANSTMTAGTTDIGLNHQKGGVATDAAGPTQTAAAKVRVTTTGTPGAGAIRITVFYRQFVAPTS